MEGERLSPGVHIQYWLLHYKKTLSLGFSFFCFVHFIHYLQIPNASFTYMHLHASNKNHRLLMDYPTLLQKKWQSCD